MLQLVGMETWAQYKMATLIRLVFILLEITSGGRNQVYPDDGTVLPGGLDMYLPDLQGASYYAEQILSDGVVRLIFKKGDLLMNMT